MAEFVTGNPRCSICAGHHPATANCFLSTNWIPLEKTPMADETVEALRHRAEAAEAQVERLKGVLESIDAVAVDFGYYEAAARTMKELALKALEAKP